MWRAHATGDRDALDAEPEQVADAADVAAGGVDLVQDPVLAQRPGTQGGVLPGIGVRGNLVTSGATRGRR